MLEEVALALPEIVSREEWLEARRGLLALEKEQTARITALNAERRRLPMVRIEKEYVFDGPQGPVTLAELFGGRSQLIIQHVMFQPEWDAACPGCTASLDVIPERLLDQVHSRDTSFVAVSRAPLAKLEAYKAARGWVVPWFSSADDFNYDFEVTVDKARGQVRYNYQDLSDQLDDGESEDVPGYSCFLRDGDEIFHTYSTYARGAERLIPAYGFLDLTAFGRSEDWEEPKGRARGPHGADPTFTD
jgi:predicted dithiol-disulfide oxidoreductase (DUF899 family)